MECMYVRVGAICVRSALASAVAVLFEPFCPIPLAAFGIESRWKSVAERMREIAATAEDRRSRTMSLRPT